MEIKIDILVLDDAPALWEALREALAGREGLDIRLLVPGGNNDIPVPEAGMDTVLICNGSAESIPEALSGSGMKILLQGEASHPGKPEDFFDITLTRPVRLGKLLAIIADTTRPDEFPAGPVQAGGLLLYPREKILRDGKSGKALNLTGMEARLLMALAEAQEQGRDELLQKVWRYSRDTATHTLETHIWRLRQKIEKQLDKPGFIETKSGGYALTTN